MYYDNDDVPLRRPTTHTMGQLKFYGYNPMKEGPQEVTIPSRSYESCSGCTFHKQKMIHSGRDPLYSHDCTHPDILASKFHGFKGNLPNEDVTPEWCPFKQ